MSRKALLKLNTHLLNRLVRLNKLRWELSQVSSVVQTNAATAEENSATSEGMSAQATTLHEEIAKFKLNYADTKDSMKEEPSCAESIAISTLRKY